MILGLKIVSICGIFMCSLFVYDGPYNKESHKNKKLEPADQLFSLCNDTFALVFMEENTVPNHYCSCVSDK